MAGSLIQTVCFRLLLHPKSGFMDGLSTVNQLELHDECHDARVSCATCQHGIANVLGISLGLIRMLKSYILRLEQGEQYQHQFE